MQDNPLTIATLAETGTWSLLCGSGRHVSTEDLSLFSHVAFLTKSGVNAAGVDCKLLRVQIKRKILQQQ